MCSALKLENSSNYYMGRNMDINYSFNEGVIIVSRNYNIKFKNNSEIKSHYAFCGMGSIIDNYPLLADGYNEVGLSVCCLNFKDNNYFMDVVDNNYLASYEVILYLLARYKSVSEVISNFSKYIADVRFKDDLLSATLHYIVSDKTRCITIEQTKEGISLIENNIGILTNDPVFNDHLLNIDNSDEIAYDSSSMSRFNRLYNMKKLVTLNEDDTFNITKFFHTLDSVFMHYGSMIIDNDYHYTTYSCCMDIFNKIYYYKTYTNNQINAVKMSNYDLDLGILYKHELNKKQSIKYV